MVVAELEEGTPVRVPDDLQLLEQGEGVVLDPLLAGQVDQVTALALDVADPLAQVDRRFRAEQALPDQLVVTLDDGPRVGGRAREVGVQVGVPVRKSASATASPPSPVMIASASPSAYPSGSSSDRAAVWRAIRSAAMIPPCRRA